MLHESIQAIVPAHFPGNNSRRPHILMNTTTWWPSVAILARSLERAGFEVTVLCPEGHTVWSASKSRCIKLDTSNPIRALANAIAAVNPYLVVPTDDRAVAHLHRLHGTAPARTRRILERSFGPSSSFKTMTSRVPLLAAAQEVGMATPKNQEIRSIAELDRWIGAIPGPWVIKVDGAWGGEGVRIAQTPEAARAAFRSLARGIPFFFAARRKMINRDPFWLADRKAGGRPIVSIHSYIRGRPGNCVIFCRNGEILGSTTVDVERSCHATGPSTLVRVVERPDFLDGARRLVHKLGMSGFCGLDFMVDDDTGEAILIEMNPRITSPCSIRTGSDPITNAAQAFGCHAPQSPLPLQGRSLFASFPLAWHAHPHDPRLTSCQDDVPWDDLALVQEALKPIWPERGAIARLPANARVLFQFLTTGRRSSDARIKPLQWWVANGLLRPPSSTEAPFRSLSTSADEPAAARSDAGRSVLSHLV